MRHRLHLHHRSTHRITVQPRNMSRRYSPPLLLQPPAEAGPLAQFLLACSLPKDRRTATLLPPSAHALLVACAAALSPHASLASYVAAAHPALRLDCTGSGSALESFARDSKQLVKDIAAADASVTNAIKYCRAFRLRAFRSPLAHRAIRAQVWGPLQAAIAGSQPLPFEPSAAPLNSMTPRLQQLQVPALPCAPAAADNDVAAAAGDDFDGWRNSRMACTASRSVICAPQTPQRFVSPSHFIVT